MKAPEEKASEGDLSSLLDISLGPEWASRELDREKDSSAKDHSAFEHDPPQTTFERRDRRHPGIRNQEKIRGRVRNRQTGPPRDSLNRREHDKSREPFMPVVNVTFRLKPEVKNALCAIMRESLKAFDLFSVARTMIQKPQRYEIVLSCMPDKSEPRRAKELFISVPDSLPFLTEAEAIEHVMKNHTELFFDIQTVGVEPPKGSFVCVKKCPFTGRILGPPNYHRYNEMLREHYAGLASRMSFDNYVAKLETLRDVESINEWIELMSKKRQWAAKPQKTEEPSEPFVFETREEAKRYLMSQQKGKAAKKIHKAVIAGECLEQITSSVLVESIRAALSTQRKQPFQTAKYLYGCFKSERFFLFKNARNGMTYVCAVKRQTLDPDSKFADYAQKLIDQIEADKQCNRQKLLNLLDLNPNEKNQALATFLENLHWLIQQGYVTEYEDGCLRCLRTSPRQKSA
jgi:hypothetical protein